MFKSVLIIIRLAVSKLKGIVVGLLICVALNDLVQLLRDWNTILPENNQLLCPSFSVLCFTCPFQINGATDDLNRLTLRS